MERNWFSNFLPFEKAVEIENIVYRTPEALYQACKTLDVNERRMIAGAETPGKAKRLGRKIKMRKDWDEKKEETMEKVQRLRLRHDNKFKDRLEKSKGEIVEWNTWHDNFWGRCVCPRCKGKGLNKLGIILMKLRNGQC